MEIINPGGLYGRLTVDRLGQAQPNTRNASLVTAMETLGKLRTSIWVFPQFAMR